MNALPDFPHLDSPEKCAALKSRYPGKVVGLWATGDPRQNVDVLWRLRRELLRLGVPALFFFKESAKPMLRTVLAAENALPAQAGGVYQLDDAALFPGLDFVDVLATSEYVVDFRASRHIPAKLVSVLNHAKMESPCIWNYFYDYYVSPVDPLKGFEYPNGDSRKVDFGFYPDSCKTHRNPHFTQVVTGYPKIDLLVEERERAAAVRSAPVLLLFPTYVDFCLKVQNIGPEKYVEIWSDVVRAFLAWRPEGLVVFRPNVKNRTHPLVGCLKARFAGEPRFTVDEDDDNKFWLARADYFVTDYSEGYTNFCLSAKRPAIRLAYSWEEQEPQVDEWGWTISKPGQLVPLLQEMDREESSWARALEATQKREMPHLGRTFPLIADMLKRILENDDDPAWLREDKGHTPCDTPADKLRLVARVVRKGGFNLYIQRLLLNNVLASTGSVHAPQIWLLLLRRALLPRLEGASPLDRDFPYEVPLHVDMWLTSALGSLPLVQSVGVIRHCLRKAPRLAATALLCAATSTQVSGPRKKRALFFLLMEVGAYDKTVLAYINEQAQKMPQYFSGPVLARLNRFLPLALKVPLPLRRLAAMALGLRKPLAREYWRAHRVLS